MILTFGELMMRIAPPGAMRFRQVMPGHVELTFAGAEANVAVGVAMLGERTRFLTALPDNPIAECAIATLAATGVDISQVRRVDRGRLGIYFYENGANQLPSRVVYDREHSAIALSGPGDYAWDAALDGVTWVHITGITSAISERGHQSNLELVRRARQRGCTISCDLNFRATLWKWEPGTDARTLARRCMAEVVPMVDVLITNHDQAGDVLDVQPVDGASSRDPAEALQAQCQQIARRYPQVRHIAMTLRESISATHNNVGGAFYDRAQDALALAPLDASGEYQPHEIRSIVDRLGGGDAFAAGLIYAMRSREYASPSRAIAFATAAGCLKHSVPGDFNFVTLNEIVSLMSGDTSGRVRR